VLEAAVTFPFPRTREPKTGDIPPGKLNIFKNTYFSVFCSANCGVFLGGEGVSSFLPSFLLSHAAQTIYKDNYGWIPESKDPAEEEQQP